MSGMFYGCEEFNQPLNDWDVSQVTDMSCMFYGCEEFNQLIDNWDVSNVRNISKIFKDCDLILKNQNISEWVTKNQNLESEIYSQYPTLLTNYRDAYVLK
jgi:surface protein